MKKYIAFLLVPVLISVISQAQQNKYSEKDFSILQGLTGTWKMETAKGIIYENWKGVESHKLMGKSFKLKNTDTIVLERVELTYKNGEIFYIPTVTNQNNQQPVPFQLISTSNKKFVFENKEHDYPQRVIYHLLSADSVHARIEGTKNGKELSSDFFYSRSE